MTDPSLAREVGSFLLFLFILIVFDVGRMTDPSLAREVGLITRHSRFCQSSIALLFLRSLPYQAGSITSQRFCQA
jgi:hypothetical protein